MKKIFLLVCFFLSFFHCVRAEVTAPLYTVDYKSQVTFADSGAVGDYSGLQNYAADYVGGYLHLSYTQTHISGYWTSYPVSLIVFSDDPTTVPNTTHLSDGLKSGMPWDTGVYFFDIQFSADGYREIVTEGESRTPVSDDTVTIGGLSGDCFVALANGYPLYDPPTEHSMSFQPMRLTEIPPSKILSFDISSGSQTATIHYYISALDSGAILDFNISSVSGISVYTATTVVATTTGDVYYSWGLPSLTDPKTTKPEDFLFYTDIKNGSKILRQQTKRASVAAPVEGYPAYTNFATDGAQAPRSGYDYLLQTLGTKLSGTLSQIDISSYNPTADYYGSSPIINFYECDDGNYGEPALTGIGCKTLVSKLSDKVDHKTAATQSFYLDTPIELDSSKYYFFTVAGDNQLNAFSYFSGSSSDKVDGGCYAYQQSTHTFSGCSDVADLYFYLRGVTRPQTDPDSASNVLFLPGIEASRLYYTDQNGDEHRMWEPLNDGNVESLFLSDNGEPISSDNIYTRDVIDEAYKDKMGQMAPNIYKSFLAMLSQMKTAGVIADYSAVAYDWRLSLDQILSGGTVTGSGGVEQISYTATSASEPYIQSELRRLAASSKSGKVTIVAHSNGGLLTKALMAKLANSDPSLLAKIDKVIFVAVPQIGTPEAVVALLHGIEQALPTDWLPALLSQHTAREFAHNLLPAYNLLPTADYFKYVDTPLVTFDDSLPEWLSRYGSTDKTTVGGKYFGTIHSPELLQNFLTDAYGRVDFGSSDINTPDSISPALLDKAKVLHSMLDDWSAPSGVKVFQIAGWGVPSTISGVTYTAGKAYCTNYFVLVQVCDTAPPIQPNPTWTIDGDGVVVTPSALWMSGDGVSRYWVNLRDYNALLNRIENLRPNNTKHKDILEILSLDEFIKQIVTNQKLDTLPQYISDTQPIAGEKDTRLVFSLRSGLPINLYDILGNHTGISTSTGALEENIPGISMARIAGMTYIFIDGTASTTARVIITSQGNQNTADDGNGNSLAATGSQQNSGGFSGVPIILQIQQFAGDTLIASTTFNILATASTTAEIYTNGKDIPTSSLFLDIDGDGQTDTALVPKNNGAVLFIASTTNTTQSDNSENNSDKKDTEDNSLTDSTPGGQTALADSIQIYTGVSNGMPQAPGKAAIGTVGDDPNSATISTGTPSQSENMATTSSVVLPETGDTYYDATTTNIFTMPTSTQAVMEIKQDGSLSANVLLSNIGSFLSADSVPKPAFWLFVLFVLFAILYIVH